MKLAPIVIFAFNRPEALRNLKNALEKNSLYAESDVYIFVDGPRNVKDEEKIKAVLQIAGEMTDCVQISSKNLGLATSVISGVSQIVEKYGKVIVLEDDLVVTPNFLNYMNQGLEYYETHPEVISVCGYGLKIKKPKNYQGDVYFSNRSSSWGWGTWKDRWEDVDWQVTDWDELKADRKKQRAFNKGGSDMYGMLRDYMEGKNQSWAIRFCYHQFKLQKYAVCPFLSKVNNEGFGSNATNCKQSYSRFKIEADTKGNSLFCFDENMTYNEQIAKSLRSYHSLGARIYSKIRRIMNM